VVDARRGRLPAQRDLPPAKLRWRTDSQAPRRVTTPAVPSPAFLLQLPIGAVGLFVLVESAGVAVDRLVVLAQYYDVPDTLIGMTVVAVGTTLLEVGSHVIASLGIAAGTLD
jgi:hypothetical protein